LCWVAVLLRDSDDSFEGDGDMKHETIDTVDRYFDFFLRRIIYWLWIDYCVWYCILSHSHSRSHPHRLKHSSPRRPYSGSDAGLPFPCLWATSNLAVSGSVSLACPGQGPGCRTPTAGHKLRGIVIAILGFGWGRVMSCVG
jgi:hypothetical protein